MIEISHETSPSKAAGLAGRLTRLKMAVRERREGTERAGIRRKPEGCCLGNLFFAEEEFYKYKYKVWNDVLQSKNI